MEFLTSNQANALLDNALKTYYSFVANSHNKKLGNMAAVATSSPSCPTDCALKKECYANFSFTGIHWRKLDTGGLDYNQVLNYVNAMKKGGYLRWGVFGDLAHVNGVIDSTKLLKLANIVKSRMLKTILYTHHNIDNFINVEALKLAFSKGLHINISCENLDKVNHALKLGLNAVLVVPTGAINKVLKKDGLIIMRCPAEYKKEFTCADCMLCAQNRVDRKLIIAFTAHGVKRKSLSDRVGI
jgi:hypothetical protein